MKILLIQSTDKDLQSMMKISKANVLAIKKILPSAKIKIAKDTKENIIQDIQRAEILVGANLQNIDLTSVNRLKWFHVTSAGVDNLSQSLLNSDIIVTNSSGVHPIPISEHVMAFILMFTRQIHKSFRIQVIEKKWKRNNIYKAVSEVYQKTIGIVGFGRIGKQIAQVSKVFKMNVLVNSLHSHSDINDLLKKSDYVINCLPYTKDTHHFFDFNKFKKMKKSSYFINIGRGKTVNEKELITALKKDIIAGAGLDVFEEEPLLSDSPLWQLDNVILTPHYAGWTPYYMDRVISIFCENLKAYLSGKRMPNLVDKKRGY